MFSIPDAEFSLVVDATTDHLNYFILIQFNYQAILDAMSNGNSLIGVIVRLIGICKTWSQQPQYKNCRLRIVYGDEEVLLFGNCPVESYHKAKVLQLQADLSEAKSRVLALTPKEFEVLIFIYQGYESERLKNELHISINTYKIHKGHVFKKMKVHSTRELVLWCEKNLSLLNLAIVDKKELA